MFGIAMGTRGGTLGVCILWTIAMLLLAGCGEPPVGTAAVIATTPGWVNSLWGHEHIVPPERADKTRPDFKQRNDAAKNEHRPYLLFRSEEIKGPNPKTITEIYVDIGLLQRDREITVDRYFVRYGRYIYASTADEIAEVAMLHTFRRGEAEPAEIKTCRPITVKLLAWQPMTAPPADYVPMPRARIRWEQAWKKAVVVWVQVSGDSDLPYSPGTAYGFHLSREPANEEMVTHTAYSSVQFWKDQMLNSAVLREDWETMKTCLKNGADINNHSLDLESGIGLMHPAVFEADDARVVKLVAEGGFADITSADWETPLLFAAGFGNLPAVKALIAAGADPTSRGRGRNTDNSLGIAVRTNNLPMVQYLVDELHMDVNEALPGHTPIAASAKGDVLAFLLNHGAKTEAEK